jgi:hypothetical protein
MKGGNMNAQDTPVPGRPRFYDLCVMYALYYDTMLLIASQAGVTKEVMDNMFLGNPVERASAIAVLKVFSQTVGHTWTIDTVKVDVLPEKDK